MPEMRKENRGRMPLRSRSHKGTGGRLARKTPRKSRKQSANPMPDSVPLSENQIDRYLAGEVPEDENIARWEKRFAVASNARIAKVRMEAANGRKVGKAWAIIVIAVAAGVSWATILWFVVSAQPG